MSKIKACPFCGYPAVIRQNKEKVKPWYVRCGNIYCHVFPMTKNYSTIEEAIEAWNRRCGG